MTSDLNHDRSGNPLSESQKEKLRLEHEAARLFMRLYEQCFAVPIRHIWHNEPKKPDVSCYLANEKLDLEIAHLYGSEVEAMMLLGRDLQPETRQILAELNQTPIEARLLKALNRLLANKAEKNYHTQRVWLVVRNVNPHWKREDFVQRRASVKLPSQHPFEQIWLVADSQGESGLVQLFPPA